MRFELDLLLEDETWTARLVEGDGNIITCLTVSDITIDQAEMIEAAREGICALDEAAFQNTVEQLLDHHEHRRRRLQPPALPRLSTRHLRA